MKLENGMYVRTEKGLFGKIIKRYEVNGYFKIIVNMNNGFIEKHKEQLFVKHLKNASHNIIDLIEVGDYVNGYKVYDGGKKHFNYIIVWDEENNYYMKIDLYTVDIKTILTKEQMENNCFRIGDE